MLTRAAWTVSVFSLAQALSVKVLGDLVLALFRNFGFRDLLRNRGDVECDFFPVRDLGLAADPAGRFVFALTTAGNLVFVGGTIAVGSDADIVIFDPEKKHTLSAKTHHMKVDYNPYEGRTTKGGPSHVFSRGNLIVEGDKWLGKTGAGKFVKRTARKV